MEFTPVIEALKKYEGIVQNARDAYQRSMKDIHRNYGNSRIGNQKLADAKAMLDSIVANAKEERLKTVEQTFTAVNEKLFAAVTAPVPADFLPNLEAIKAIGKNLSKNEAEMYIQKYSNNYSAYRSIASVLGSLGVCKVYPVNFERIKDDMEKLHSFAVLACSDDIGGDRDYKRRLLMADMYNDEIKFLERLKALESPLVPKYQNYCDELYLKISKLVAECKKLKEEVSKIKVDSCDECERNET